MVDLDTGPSGVPAVVDEQRRAERMRDEGHRARFLASRAWLRVVLGRYLDADPAAVGFDIGDRGKPSIVDGGDLRFSLSRSAAVALIAVTRGRAVGVDVEQIRDDVDHGRLARQLFSPAEADAVLALPEPHRRDAFFDLWVRKEAVLKASGAGLGDGLSHLDVRHDLVAGRWSVTSVAARSGFAAAAAVEGVMRPPVAFSLPADDRLRG
jgi:phosphopantetheinyl transferase